jgi:hypothetical protein
MVSFKIRCCNFAVLHLMFAPHDLAHSRHVYIHSTKTERFVFTNTRYLMSIILMCIIESVDGRTNRCLIGSRGLNSKSIVRPFRLLLPQPVAIKTFCRYASRYSRERPTGTMPLGIPWSEVSFRKSFWHQHPYQMMFNVAWTCKENKLLMRTFLETRMTPKQSGDVSQLVGIRRKLVLQLRLRKS